MVVYRKETVTSVSFQQWLHPLIESMTTNSNVLSVPHLGHMMTPDSVLFVYEDP